MIGYEEALHILREVALSRGVGSETVRLENARGRVASEILLSPEPSPPFDNSAMDGFALRSQATEKASPENPVRFKVRGTIAAGDPLPRLSADTDPSSAWEIMTGAPVPPGYDSVIKVEDVRTSAEGEIEIRQRVKLSENVRYQGEDFKVGHQVLAAGATVRADHVMGLASLGFTDVPVYRRPRVAVISTGHELKPHTIKHLETGQIRNSSGPYLMSALPELGLDPVFYAVSEDRIEDFLKHFDSATELKPDFVLTTGAVSAGRFDFVKEALSQRTARHLFHKVSIRPGKPILFSDLGERVSFGLPGNPISTAVGLRFFVSPYARALMTLPPEKPLKARLTSEVQKPESLRCFFKARVRLEPEGLCVTVLHGQSSFMIHSLNEANAWVILPEGPKTFAAGDEASVLPLRPDHWEFDV